MDAYLQIAEAVLKAERRPLSPRAILAAAYRSGIVPVHLYGKTQHKTLGARLSEDIIERRDKSIFFRAAPGRFFIREYLTDVSIPDEYRQPIATRRRVRELMRGPALALDARDLSRIGSANTLIDPRKVFSLLSANGYHYDEPRNRQHQQSVFVWSFVSVHRSWEILSYRLGRYRDNRDMFMSKRSVGFSSLVHRDDRTLFDFDSFGIIESGIRATKIDLDIPDVPARDPDEARLIYFAWVSNSETNDLLAVINFKCPNWFEPVKRRLALNELRWLDCRSRVNNIEDFDPWSKIVLLEQYRASGAEEAGTALAEARHFADCIGERD